MRYHGHGFCWVVVHVMLQAAEFDVCFGLFIIKSLIFTDLNFSGFFLEMRPLYSDWCPPSCLLASTICHLNCLIFCLLGCSILSCVSIPFAICITSCFRQQFKMCAQQLCDFNKHLCQLIVNSCWLGAKPYLRKITEQWPVGFWHVNY